MNISRMIANKNKITIIINKIITIIKYPEVECLTPVSPWRLMGPGPATPMLRWLVNKNNNKNNNRKNRINKQRHNNK